FVDLVDSTALAEALDPEVVRGLIGRYFEVVAQALDRHGGTLEKFVGDAVMAVFGLPAVHEDDALRAVRAAVEAREALAALNSDVEAEAGLRIAAPVGIDTGEEV